MILQNKKILTDTDVKETDIKWLFYPYIPRGEVTILNADPGSGKTYIASWIAAKITSGYDFPLDSDRNVKGSMTVAYLSKEDKYDTTIIPRFRACGGKKGKLLFLSLEDMPDDFSDPIIEDLIGQGVDLIIFDAVSSFIGTANMNQSNEVRRALYPLYKKISGTKTAILLIAHNNKMGGVTNPQYRITGSVDFAAFVRSGLTIAKRDNEFILAQYKNNFLSNGKSLSFNLVKTDEHKLPGLEFNGISPLSAEELTGANLTVKKNSVTDDIASLLYQKLTENNGFAKVKEINAFLKNLGYKKSSIDRARKSLGVRSEIIYDQEKKKTVGYLVLPGVKVDIFNQLSFFQKQEKTEST